MKIYVCFLIFIPVNFFFFISILTITFKYI